MKKHFKSLFNKTQNVPLKEKDMFKIDNKTSDKLDLKSAEYILNEGKSHLENTIQESNKITQRAFSIFSIYVGFISASCAYVLSNYQSENSSVYFVFGLSLVLSCFIFHLLKIILPRKISYKGAEPFKLVKSPLFNDSIPQEHKYKILILNELKFVQNKITKNKEMNNLRSEKLKNVLIFSPIFLVIYFVFSFLIFPRIDG